MTDGGKGSRPRPFSVSNEEYARRWDAIFGRDSDPNKHKDSDQAESKAEKDQQETESAK